MTTSKYRGVCWNKAGRKWYAQIGYSGEDHYLGTFSDERSAAEAYDAAALELHGDKAKTNFDPKKFWHDLRIMFVKAPHAEDEPVPSGSPPASEITAQERGQVTQLVEASHIRYDTLLLAQEAQKERDQETQIVEASLIQYATLLLARAI